MSQAKARGVKDFPLGELIELRSRIDSNVTMIEEDHPEELYTSSFGMVQGVILTGDQASLFRDLLDAHIKSHGE